MTRTRTFTARIALLATRDEPVLPRPGPRAGRGAHPRARMYRVTNHTRYDFGVRRVGIQYRLSQLARQHSIAMANRRLHLPHGEPLRVLPPGHDLADVGENVGDEQHGREHPAGVHELAHRANILNRGFHRVAIGTYRDANGFLWVTVFFYG